MRIARLLLAALLTAAAAGPAAAQPPGQGVPLGPAVRPTFSPYLNLLRRDTPGAVNYYGLVRSQLATRAALQSVQQQLVATGQDGANAAGPELLATGQPVWFLNTGGYFLNLGAGGGPARAPARNGRLNPPR